MLDIKDVSSYLYIVMHNDVRERRLQRELSQAELAQAMNVSRQTINSIETGRYIPSLPLALALGRFFGVPVEEMFDADH
jgi:putative transcriptional regulator